MNTALETFLDGLKEGVLIHLVLSNKTIIGTFFRIDDKRESVILTRASIFGETLAGKTSVAISEITAWGRGGKFNK